MALLDLHNWTAESYDRAQIDALKYNAHEAEWVVSNDGKSVSQQTDCQPTFFYSDFSSFHNTISVKLKVQSDVDDDHIGFALNFKPGDTTNPNADFLVLHWSKSTSQMKLCRVSGIPNYIDFIKLPEVATAKTLASTGWNSDQTYEFKFACSQSKLKIWVDGNLEFDLDGQFEDGRFACYSCSQAAVLFSDVEADISVSRPETNVELTRWTAESYDRNQIGAAKEEEAKWVITAAQIKNGQPTFFYSDFNCFGAIISAQLYVETATDDDFVGFALNFQPGDTGNENANFLLLSWNAQPQRAGLKLCRVSGIPLFLDFLSLPEIAIAKTLGSIPWQPKQLYEFKFKCSQNKLQVWVDDNLEFDVDGDFEDGRFACFDCSQAMAIFSEIQAQI
ncbi:hypothetical protein [Crocosphaera sp.]|uniref:hypothetical protein n=1 Tax=Crocosphaera sp. TaxID=2729996 RepID=UPI003F262A1C|nr:hypothetical protein [Crocosphaera sp.]